jgi:hypothetical protein
MKDKIKFVQISFRFGQYLEELFEQIQKYSLFMRGEDKRGRNFGVSTSQRKQIYKDFVAKYGSIDGFRRYVASKRFIEVISPEGIRSIPLGNNEGSFLKAVDMAFHLTKDWKEYGGSTIIKPNDRKTILRSTFGCKEFFIIEIKER